jgi:DTW domain-containing protein YfiP
MVQQEDDQGSVPEHTQECPQCGRAKPYCVCEFVTPLSTKTEVLVLQHPQEPGVDIGTVSIIQTLLPHAVIRTGLSWPNLRKALGREVEPQTWGVLYVGSVRTEQLPKDRTVFVVDKKGTQIADQHVAIQQLKGIVLLDGTWSQAKTLWWRNAWLLKLKRLVIRSGRRSLYDRIRKEPRQGCLSSIETLGEVLSVIEQRDDIIPAVERPLRELVERLARSRPRTGHPGGRNRHWRRPRKQQ